MLFLLHKIRRKLLASNKVTTYLLYAIGEIVLVVIGILIAVSIDDWNGQQKKIANEEELMQAIRQELESNLYNLQSALDADRKYMKDAFTLQTKLSGGLNNLTEKEISQSLDYNFFFMDSPILNDMITKNADVLINRKNLIHDFRKLSYDYNKIVSSCNYLDELWNTHLTTFFINTGINYQPTGGNYQPPASTDERIDLTDFENKGYSKKQLQAIINLKIKHQEIRETSMVGALENTRQTLIKMQSKINN